MRDRCLGRAGKLSLFLEERHRVEMEISMELKSRFELC